MKTALVTLGRLPKGLDICRALSVAGWRVVVAEPSSKHLCGLSRSVSNSVATPAPNHDAAAYQQALLRIVADEGVSLVVPVSEEIMHASRIVPSLPDSVRWFGLDHDVLLPLHDKFRFNRLAASLGLSVPQTDLLGSDAARALVADGDVIVKPALTCSGQGLERVTKGAALPDTRSEDILVQRALNGGHSSTFSIAHEGRAIGTVVYRPVVVSDTVAVAFERLTGAVEQENWAARFIAETQHTGFISFDFVDNEDGAPCAIECNPRATSGIHFVTADSLASAILEPEMRQALAFREPTVMHQFWPLLTEIQGSMFRRGRGYGHKMKTLLTGKEVNFAWRDPMPVIAQPYAAWDIMRRAMTSGESFGEAATLDIAWFGENG
ncbi:MAG: ATP-grasp domain-containing protein [Pseudomonadota bacterium]